jgi:hypothetical protein
MQPSLFDIQPTLDRRNASYHSLQPHQVNGQIEAVKNALRCDIRGLTSRSISEVTGIERTTVTRILKENEALFDSTLSTFDEKTNRTVTLYRLRGNNG